MVRKKKTVKCVRNKRFKLQYAKNSSKSCLRNCVWASLSIQGASEIFSEGKAICKKQFDTLSSILSKEDLSSPASWVSEVTDSTIPPFSDKLMLSHIVILVSAGVGYLGAALSDSQRRDLTLKYTILMADMERYAEDGAQLLIEYGWMEQPPLAKDRNHLANIK
ncbi:DUF3231 family protein [Neobacillus drentensis]|uniref:DUF3231 family protein n=1 Tax=Neobacillus drentensis TaxID=220684 RepID=UPI002FFDD7DC